MASLGLLAFTGLNAVGVGQALSASYQSNRVRIVRDFPHAGANYRMPGYATSTVIARRNEAGSDYQAYAIAWEDGGLTAMLGVVSIARLPMPDTGNSGLQVAFWAGSRRQRRAHGYGKPLLPALFGLIDNAAAAFEPQEPLWTVARHDHAYVRSGLQDAGYTAVGAPADYSELDGVEEPRVLYVKALG